MNDSSKDSFLGKSEKILVLALSFLLAISLLFFKGRINSENPLDTLARSSLEPDSALLNGRPTVFEFYADWCEICQEMAPSMLTLERNLGENLDIVLLNVDNSRWQDLISKYDVNGIPQLNLFDENGILVAKSIGLRTEDELMGLGNALISKNKLPEFSGVDKQLSKSTFKQNIDTTLTKTVLPRGHA